MKKTKKILLFVIACVMLLSTTVFAEVKTVEVSYYEGEEARFTISDVTGIWGTMKMYEQEYNVYEAYPSSNITLLENSYAIFHAQKLSENNGDFSFTEELVEVSSGQVTVWVTDESGKLDEYGYPLIVEKTIDVSELSNYDYDIPGYSAGSTITLTEPGFYYVVYQPEAVEGLIAFVRVLESENAPEPVVEEVSSTVTALPTSSPVLVNGEEKSFEAYNIDGYNYFKLRDLALALTDSEKQFNVQWDNEKNAINLISNEAYTTVGGEMAAGDGITKTGILNTSAIYKDGVEVQLTAYNINGNNYFKLRDLMDAFNIEVTWDNDTQTIGINTKNFD